MLLVIPVTSYCSLLGNPQSFLPLWGTFNFVGLCCLSSQWSSVSCSPELPSRTASRSSTPSSVSWSLTSSAGSRWKILFSVTRTLRKSPNQAGFSVPIIPRRAWYPDNQKTREVKSHKQKAGARYLVVFSGLTLCSTLWDS